MPKKKRTLKQKKQADVRQIAPSAPHVSTGETSGQYTLEHISLPKTKAPVRPSSTAVISTSEYAYIAPDLLKTFLITIAVVLVELFIRYVAIGNY